MVDHQCRRRRQPSQPRPVDAGGQDWPGGSRKTSSYVVGTSPNLTVFREMFKCKFGYRESADRRWPSPPGSLGLAAQIPVSAASRRVLRDVLDDRHQGRGHGAELGWFHPAQSRYGWKWLEAATRTATARSPRRSSPAAELFPALDRDRDGTITADDLTGRRVALRPPAGRRAKAFVDVDTKRAERSHGRMGRLLRKPAQGQGAFIPRRPGRRDCSSPPPREQDGRPGLRPRGPTR